jgi:predicted porin
MQKKIIALAVAAAISGPAFADNANITFYGVADVSNDWVTTGNGTSAANGNTTVDGTTKRVISSNTSKFGFKGAEDLGDGLHAIWQIEQQVDLDASTNSTAGKQVFATRNTFAGLKSESYGTVLMGIHDTPMKISTRRLDVFGDNIADNRSMLGKAKVSFDSRIGDALAYISPAFSGVTVAVATANLSETSTTGSTANASALSAAAMYDVAPFYAAVAYESHNLTSTAQVAPTAARPDPSESAMRAGLGFKGDGYELNAMYESTTDNQGTLNVKKYGHTAYYVGGKLKVTSNGTVKVAYTSMGTLGDTGENDNSSATQVTVGYDHAMSKRTTLYALYSRISNGTGSNYGFKDASTAGGTNSVNGYGGTPTAISLGMKHSF